MTPEPSENSPTVAASHSSPEKSWRPLKWLMGFVLMLTGLLLVAGLLLTYWFPANLVREKLEVQLSELLQGTVTIRSLSFNALTGLQVEDIAFHKPDQPPFTLARLTLDYSFLGLFQGVFRINEVTIEQANISLNLPELSKGAEPDQSEVPPPTEPTALPSFPIDVDLETFAIVDSQLQVIVSPDLHLDLSTINLGSSGAVSSEKANVKGQLSIDQLALVFQGNHLQLPITMMFDTQLDIVNEHLNLEELTILSDPALRLTLSGTMNDIFTQDHLQVSLTDTRINLDALRKLVQDFVPPEWVDAAIQGSLSPHFSIKGSLPNGQFLGTIQAGLKGRNLQVNLPSLALDLGPTTLDIQAEDLRVSKNQPTEGRVSGKITLENLTFQSNRLETFDLVLTGEGKASGPFSGGLDVSGTTQIPSEFVGTSFSLPFDLTLNANGNYQTREVHMEKMELDLDSYGSLDAKADFTPQMPQGPDLDASLMLRIRPRLEALLALLPREHLEGFALNASSKPETLVLRVKGLLEPDFNPKWMTAAAALKLSSINTSLGTVGSVALDQLTFLLSSKYQQQDGKIQGMIGVSTNLSDLRAKENLKLDALNLILKSSFQGNVSPTFQPINLRSKDQLQITLRNISFHDASITATLPSLKLALNTKEDLMRQDFVIDHLAVRSHTILDLTMQGRFSQATQRFAIDLQAPLIHIGNLLSRMSGPLMEGMDAIDPKGRLELTMQAEGRLPEQTDLEKLSLPLGLKSSIKLRDLAGAVAGYRVQGGNGTLELGYSPDASPQTQLTSALLLNHIALPDTLPISQLEGAALQFKAASPDLNEVQIDPIRVKAEGIDFTTKAVLVGVHDFLATTSTPLGTKLAKLFVQLDTQLGVDLKPLHPALQTYGVTGNGNTQVALHLYKQEHGDLNATLNLHTKKLSAEQEGMALRNINGGLLIRKSLRWNPNDQKTPSLSTFLPSDRIAQLKMFSGKGERLSIDGIRFGSVNIEKFSAYITFQQQVLRIQNVAMNLLGGGIGGNIALAAEHPLHLSADFELANLDVNNLLTENQQISGDSKISASLALDSRFQDETGAVDLSRLSCRINITHIGKEALDRLLVFLDPEGSNPTLSNARAQLKLANPSRVNIDIARGQLNLVIEFQGSLLSKFTLNRIPIAKMRSLEALTAAIPNWETLLPLLDMIAAETYSFSPQGELLVK